MVADKFELLFYHRHGIMHGDGKFDTPARRRSGAPQECHCGGVRPCT
jgi:hypothetical protein